MTCCGSRQADDPSRGRTMRRQGRWAGRRSYNIAAVPRISRLDRPGRGVAQRRFVGEAGFLAVGEHAVGVRILAGEEGRAAGQAQRVGDEGLVEAQALGADAVQVRRLEGGVAVDAHRTLGVVVGHDEDDVGALRRRARCIRRAAAEPARQRKPDARGAQPLQCASTIECGGHWLSAGSCLSGMTVQVTPGICPARASARHNPADRRPRSRRAVR